MAAELVVHYGIPSIPLVQVALFLYGQPGPNERALISFFLPPVVAAQFILADNGRFNRTAVRGAWILLYVTAIASLIAEIDALPIKMQFKGKLPPPIDRVMVCYLAGWYSFMFVVCPTWYLRWRIMGDGRTLGAIGWKAKVGWGAWALFVVFLLVSSAVRLF